MPGSGNENKRTLITVLTLNLAQFLQLFTLKGLVLPIFNGGRLFKVLPPLVFPDNSLFLNHAFETLDRFFQRFIFTYTYVGDLKSPPFAC